VSGALDKPQGLPPSDDQVVARNSSRSTRRSAFAQLANCSIRHTLSAYEARGSQVPFQYRALGLTKRYMPPPSESLYGFSHGFAALMPVLVKVLIGILGVSRFFPGLGTPIYGWLSGMTTGRKWTSNAFNYSVYGFWRTSLDVLGSTGAQRGFKSIT